MKKGKLIVLDGSDGSGKKTQCTILLKKLQEAGYKVAFFDFPQYEKFFGKMVANYLNGDYGNLDQINPYLISLPYALDRKSVKQEMEEKINSGHIVICNRYTPSNLAHQSAKFETKLEQDNYVKWDEELEYEINKIPKPDTVIYLYVPSEIAQSLVDKKNQSDRAYAQGKKRDLHEINDDHLKKASERYLELAKEKSWHKIDCVQDERLLSIDEVSGRVWEIIRKESL
jgi:dTMP kinase